MDMEDGRMEGRTDKGVMDGLRATDGGLMDGVFSDTDNTKRVKKQQE